MNTQTIRSLILTVVIVAFVVIYLTVNKWIKFQAVDNCLRSGKSISATQDNNGGKYTNEEPHRYWYETCMKEKGLMKK